VSTERIQDDETDQDSFNGEHFEGLGDKWRAIFGEPDDITDYLQEILSTKDIAATGKIFDEGTERNAILLKYPDEAASASAGSLLLYSDDKKSWDLISAYPVLEGLPNRLSIIATHTWENGLEGEVAANISGGPWVDFFDPYYLRDKDLMWNETERTFSLAALALSIEKLGETKFTVKEGAFYEDRLKNFLAENPGKTEKDFEPPVISMNGARILFPTNYVSELEYQCPVLSVDEVYLLKKKIYKMSVEFVGMDDEMIRGFLYAPESVLNGYIPQAGDDIRGVLWMTGYLIDTDNVFQETETMPDWETIEKELKDNVPSMDLVNLHEREYISREHINQIRARNREFFEKLPQLSDYFIANRGYAKYPKIDIDMLLVSYPKIRMKPGFALDYVYAADHHGGEPFLYARRREERPLSSYKEYCAKFCVEQKMLLGSEPTIQQTYPVLRGVEVDNDADSFFELAMFTMQGRRFHLFDHSNYNNRKYIVTEKGLEKFIQERIGGYSINEIAVLKRLTPNPFVVRIDDFAVVVVLSYEMNIGYSFLQIYFRNNLFVKKEDIVILRSKGMTFY
jgi:hypothetical protein